MLSPRIHSATSIEPAHDFLSPVDLPFAPSPPLYGAMLVAWLLRPALQRRFPLQNGRPRDYLRFLAWCVVEGRRQYAAFREIADGDDVLSRPVELPPLAGDRWAGAFSLGMFLFGVAKSHYTVDALLHSAQARHRVARAFWRGERHVRGLPPPAAWQRADLIARFPGAGDLISAIRLAKTDAGKSDGQLVEEFGLADVVGGWSDDPTGGDPAPVVPSAAPPIALPDGLALLPFALPRRVARSIGWLLGRLRAMPDGRELADVARRIPLKPRPRAFDVFPFGVNLFGYARGELGIGEDVRLVALALEARGIPFCIVNLQPGADVSQADDSVAAWIVDSPRYSINIFCVTGIELARFACEKGLDAFRGRYSIGLWPWELPRWPASCRFAYSLVDEIWGISRYAADAYRDAPCPVRPMTLPVVAGPVDGCGRAEFGLPGDAYLFIFSFDVNSTFARKNPEAVIAAFQKAFPRGGDDCVGLVLKVNHAASARSRAWARIRRAVKGDSRLHLIDETLRKPRVLALYRCCDCFVSLHRAEGFGRGLAESLLLGRQLIATAYSGNMDFCTPGRVGLVRYKMRGLGKGDYFHGEGQQWAEPDIEHAAELMRCIKDRPLDPRGLEHDFSPQGVGRLYAERLLEIRQQMTAEGNPEC